MDYTQNSKIEQVKESTLIIGIDVGSETHYARAFDWRGRELTKKVFCFRSDIEGFLTISTMHWLPYMPIRISAVSLL